MSKRTDPYSVPIIDASRPVKVKLDLWRALAVIASTFSACGVGWFWIASDNHNDARYVTKAQMQETTRHRDELLARDLTAIRETHARQQYQLDNISSDVKILIRSIPTTPTPR